MDFKKTLSIPQTSFEMKANLNLKEPKIQNFWFENEVYQKRLEKNKGKKLFLLLNHLSSVPLIGIEKGV